MGYSSLCHALSTWTNNGQLSLSIDTYPLRQWVLLTVDHFRNWSTMLLISVKLRYVLRNISERYADTSFLQCQRRCTQKEIGSCRVRQEMVTSSEGGLSIWYRGKNRSLHTAIWFPSSWRFITYQFFNAISEYWFYCCNIAFIVSTGWFSWDSYEADVP